jgi:hypothetical protein
MVLTYAHGRERMARKVVEAHEKKKGGEPHDSPQGSGYDMQSRGRKIEIRTRLLNSGLRR